MAVTTKPSAWMPGETSRAVSLVFTVLSFTPAALLITFIAHALHVRAVLGRWPQAYRDAPQSPLLSIHETAFLYPLAYFVMFGMPLWVVASALRVRTGQSAKREVAREATRIVVAVAVIIALAVVDRTGYVAWFLD